jgi:quercetin dioxygenase-like cupin family protein
MSVQMIRYEAGFTNPWHRHNCAHGIYVLEGTLKTHAGNFGPGNFVWFPQGMLMEHGATKDGRRDHAVHHQQALRHPLRPRG